jgi:hypothetical protein
MDTHVEQELRRALAARAAELPSDASRRLLSVDYRPRSGLERPVLAVGGLAAAAGAVVAVSIVGLGADTPRAFAGWSATPSAHSANRVRRVQRACSSLLPTSAGIEHRQKTASGTYRPWPMPRIAAGGWHAVVVDTRGPYTMILFTAAHDAAELSCFSGLKPVSLGGSFATHPPLPVLAGHVSIVSSGSTSTPPAEGSQHFSQVVGRTGRGVTAVTLTLRSGTRVRASLGHGWFLAWWPGTQRGTATDVTSSHATSVR